MVILQLNLQPYQVDYCREQLDLCAKEQLS